MYLLLAARAGAAADAGADAGAGAAAGGGGGGQFWPRHVDKNKHDNNGGNADSDGDQ